MTSLADLAARVRYVRSAYGTRPWRAELDGVSLSGRRESSSTQSSVAPWSSPQPSTPSASPTSCAPVAGSHVSSVNSRGVVGIIGHTIDLDDIARVIDSARAVAIPHNREIIHVIQRGFTIDGQDGIRAPLGMHGYRLEVETHIITAAAATVENLRQCVAASGVQVTQFVLNPLASAEVVLSETERQMGVLIRDMGGGTTDIAICIDGDIWHTAVLAVGGNHITSDIVHGLRLPVSQAEEIKLHHGHALPAEVGAEEYFSIRPFGEDKAAQIFDWFFLDTEIREPLITAISHFRGTRVTVQNRGRRDMRE